MKILTGDTVVVITGKDKGKKGTVMRVLPAEARVLVAGINMITKHVKKTPQTEGRKFKTERSIHVSNVMLVDPKSGKPTRVGYKIDEKGKKTRIAKRSGETVMRTKVSKDEAKKQAAAAPGEAAPPKKSFWRRGGAAADQGASPKAEAGPALSTPGHARSAGRGS